MLTSTESELQVIAERLIRRGWQVVVLEAPVHCMLPDALHLARLLGPTAVLSDEGTVLALGVLGHPWRVTGTRLRVGDTRQLVRVLVQNEKLTRAFQPS